MTNTGAELSEKERESAWNALKAFSFARGLAGASSALRFSFTELTGLLASPAQATIELAKRLADAKGVSVDEVLGRSAAPPAHRAQADEPSKRRAEAARVARLDGFDEAAIAAVCAMDVPTPDRSILDWLLLIRDAARGEPAFTSQSTDSSSAAQISDKPMALPAVPDLELPGERRDPSNALCLLDYASLSMALEVAPDRAPRIFEIFGLTDRDLREREIAEWKAYLEKRPDERRRFASLRESSRSRWQAFSQEREQAASGVATSWPPLPPPPALRHSSSAAAEDVVPPAAPAAAPAPAWLREQTEDLPTFLQHGSFVAEVKHSGVPVLSRRIEPPVADVQVAAEPPARSTSPYLDETPRELASWSVVPPVRAQSAEPPPPPHLGRVTSIEQYAELAAQLNLFPEHEERIFGSFGIDDLAAGKAAIGAWGEWIAAENERRAEWRLRYHRALARWGGSDR